MGYGYASRVGCFLKTDEDTLVGQLANGVAATGISSHRSAQVEAWQFEIRLLKELKWTQSFGQESRLVKLESSTPIHCQAGTSSGVRLTSDWCTWFLPSSNTWAGVL